MNKIKSTLLDADVIGFLDPKTGNLISLSSHGVNNHEDLAVELGFEDVSEAGDTGLIRVSALNAFQMTALTDQALNALDKFILDAVDKYPKYFSGNVIFYVDSDSGYQTATLDNILDKGLKNALKSTKLFAKEEEKSPLSYGIDALDEEFYQGDKEEIYRNDRYQAYRGWKFWVTPENEMINIGPELHNNWAVNNKGVQGIKLLEEGWIRITDDQQSGEILFDIPDFSTMSLKRVDDNLEKEPGFSKFKTISLYDNKNFHVLRMSEVLRLGTERALKMYKKQINYASKGNKMANKYRLDIPLNFLENYFFHTVDSEGFNHIREELVNTLEKNEHYFLDLGADPKEIVELESSIQMSQTPGIFDQALEKLYEFGNKYHIWFENTMMKESAVTPARVFHKLLTAWKIADSPNWVPKIDRALENVSIEFSDGTKMAIFDDKSVDMFLAQKKQATSIAEFNKVWIDPQDKVIPFKDEELMHSDVIYKLLQDYPKVPSNYSEKQAFNMAIDTGWIRKGETEVNLYFTVKDLNDVFIGRMQDYINNNPDSIYGKAEVEIDYGFSGRDWIRLSGEDVEKYGLKSAIARKQRQTVMGSKKTRKLKKISYTDYTTGLSSYLSKKLGKYSIDSETIEKLASGGYRIALSVMPKGKQASIQAEFDTIAKHIDDYNTSIGHSIYSNTDVVILKKSENVSDQTTDSDNIQDEELLAITNVVSALKFRGFEVTAEDYIEWMTDSHTTNEGADRFNQVVLSLLTEPVYNVFKRLNLCNAKLRFELGLGAPTVDGVDLTQDPEISEVPAIDGCPIQSGEPTVVYVVSLDGLI